MKLTIEMPWERDLTVNHMRFGARGGYRKKPHVQAWMKRLEDELGLDPRFRVDQYRDGSYFPFWEGELIREPLTVEIDFRYPDKRRRDSHNFFKVMCDAIARGLWVDDKDILISARSVVVDRENPGFTIEMSDEKPIG